MVSTEADIPTLIQHQTVSNETDKWCQTNPTQPRLEQRMQGWQHAWLQTSQGRWVAVVSVRVASANEQSHASIPLTVAAGAIGPAETVTTKDEP